MASKPLFYLLYTVLQAVQMWVNFKVVTNHQSYFRLPQFAFYKALCRSLCSILIHNLFFQKLKNIWKCWKLVCLLQTDNWTTYCYKQTFTQDIDVMDSGIHGEVLRSSGEQKEECCSVMNFDNLYFDKHVIKGI